MRIIWNIPNVLTLSRFVLSPVFFIFLIYGYTKTALFFFLIVALTDYVDGVFARATNQITKLGEILDPLADKFMIFLAVLGLAIKFNFPYWAIPLILVRDIVSFGGSFVYFSDMNKERWKVKHFGRITTVFQIITVIVFIVNLEFRFIVLYFTIALSVITGVAYLVRGVSALNRPF